MQLDANRKLYKFSGPTEYALQTLDEQPSFLHWRDITRIACFGSEPDNLLMWSHYADGLRGLCLVFDDDELLEASPRSTFAVNVAYQKNPPTADAFIYAIANDQMDFHLMSIEEAEDRSKHIGERDPFVEDYRKVAGDAYLSKTEILQRVFATKPLEWEYEAERRLLVRASGNDTEPIFHRFPKTALREILIGERMPDSFRARLEALVAEHYSHVSTRAVARSSSTYRLKIR